jgi:hypothetical protein
LEFGYAKRALRFYGEFFCAQNNDRWLFSEKIPVSGKNTLT